CHSRRGDTCERSQLMHDPRVFFAAERTLLAWVRTGLTIMAFGFVVARFGLFLRLLAMQQQEVVYTQTHSNISNIVGIALVLVGTACMILGAVQHRSYVSTLPPADVPRCRDPSGRSRHDDRHAAARECAARSRRGHAWACRAGNVAHLGTLRRPGSRQALPDGRPTNGCRRSATRYRHIYPHHRAQTR